MEEEDGDELSQSDFLGSNQDEEEEFEEGEEGEDHEHHGDSNFEQQLTGREDDLEMEDQMQLAYFRER